jgi:hypothetical protein
MESSNSIDRREAMKRVAFLMGGAVSAPTLAGVMSGCSASEGDGWTPQALSSAENELVTEISEMIIPATDTPGAKAARVNRFIDKMMAEWYYADERDHFLDGLADADARAREQFGSRFVDASEENRTALLEELEQEALAADDPEYPPFFSRMKELTLSGYYTSEIGMTEELQWEAVPGYYEGCVPLEEIGRAWA